MIEFPLYTAIEFRKELTGGTTLPCVLLCESDDGSADEYVTKLRHTVRGSMGLGFEYIAAHLARRFSVPMPNPAVIRITSDFAETLGASAEVRSRLLQSLGLNFGTRYEVGLTTWIPSRRIPERLRQVAMNVLAFDALIDNVDRRREKPNLLAGAERLLAIDHELSFGFLRLVGQPTAWFDRLQFLRTHPLYDGLRGSPLNLTPFEEGLEFLSDEIIQSICSAVPVDFGREHLEPIAAHLRAVRDNRADFLLGLSGVMR